MARGVKRTGSGGDDTPAPTRRRPALPQPNANDTEAVEPTRRKAAHTAARSRAAHFAFHPDARDDGSDGSDKESGSDKETDDKGEEGVDGKEAPRQRWPGPWSTAKDLESKREAAKEAREETIRLGSRAPAGGASAKPRAAAWKPSQAPSTPAQRGGGPKRLFDICLALLVEHVDAMESLVGVPDLVRRRYAEALGERRKLSPEVLKLLGGAHTGELVAPDCHQIKDDTMKEVLCALDSSVLERLELMHCGRGLGDGVAAAFAAAHASGLPRLQTVKLGGAYKLSGDGLCALLQPCSALESLALTAASRIGGAGLSQMASVVGSTLTELDLSQCNHLVDIDLKALMLPQSLSAKERAQIAGGELPLLSRLSLNGLDKIKDTVVKQIASSMGERLLSLDLSDCELALTDGCVRGVAAACPKLETLLLEGGEKLTDKSIKGVAKGCTKLQTLSLARCRHLSEKAVSASVSAWPSLRHLNLNSIVSVDDATLKSLAEAAGNELETLDLSWCTEFSEDALGHLADKCRRLKRVSVWGCRQVQARFIEGHGKEGLEVDGGHAHGLKRHADGGEGLKGSA